MKSTPKRSFSGPNRPDQLPYLLGAIEHLSAVRRNDSLARHQLATGMPRFISHSTCHLRCCAGLPRGFDGNRFPDESHSFQNARRSRRSPPPPCPRSQSRPSIESSISRFPCEERSIRRDSARVIRVNGYAESNARLGPKTGRGSQSIAAARGHLPVISP